MQNPNTGITESEQKAIVSFCILAAFADGNQTEQERSEIKKIAENFSGGSEDITVLYQNALSGKMALPTLARELQSANAKALAYEMAVCLCSVDGAVTETEQRFLRELRAELKLPESATSQFDQQAVKMREQPPVITNVATPAPSALDETIRDTAILTGALELMPQRLATMAIVPVQMRMVYKIGKAFGHELDLGHAQEFLATVGVGLTSQVLDGYLSKIVGNVSRRFVGRFAGGLLSQATESAIAFATTYAVGQVAKTSYQSGRTLSAAQLRDTFSAMLNDGRAIQSRYSSQIAQRASSLKVADFVSLATK